MKRLALTFLGALYVTCGHADQLAEASRAAMLPCRPAMSLSRCAAAVLRRAMLASRSARAASRLVIWAVLLRGLRITPYDILSMLSSVMPQQKILDDFPELAPEDIQAALVLAYAAEKEYLLLNNREMIQDALITKDMASIEIST